MYALARHHLEVINHILAGRVWWVVIVRQATLRREAERMI
jgi:hypothetical protein